MISVFSFKPSFLSISGGPGSLVSYSGRQVQNSPPVLEDPLATDDNITDAFTQHHGDNWRYCARLRKWLVWTGQRGSVDEVL